MGVKDKVLRWLKRVLKIQSPSEKFYKWAHGYPMRRKPSKKRKGF